MGRSVQRKGDANKKGGIITSGDSSVLVNGRPIAVPNSKVAPHPKCSPKAPLHCIAKTTPSAKTVRVNGKPLVLTGGKDTCGDARAGGSSNVKAV
jgi:uncharacterized Zn-binding protein involved in type VI secretion